MHKNIQVTKLASELLPHSFLEPYSNKPVPWGFNGLGYIVFKRTYSRLKSDGQHEEWWETIARCIHGAQEIGAQYTPQEAQELYDLIFNLKCCFSGRALWQLGTETVQKFGANSLLNCWFTRIACPADFCFLFENLMLGGGVGFSIRREDVHELPTVRKGVDVILENTKDADFIVPDSRKGWIALLRRTLDSYFVNGEGFSYSTILVRGAGEPIKGFGGTASGPKILEDGIAQICKILTGREGKKLRSVDALDICNIIGSVVVSGNVRRSAEIALGDADDILFLKAKRWDLGNIPNWRAMSNNTIYADDYDYIMEHVWDGYGGNGEPYGFFNLELARSQGRLGEKCRDGVLGMNPCGELPLADKECCNLSDIFLNNVQSKEELIRCSKLLYKTQKAICAMPFLHDETNKIVHKNFRIGQGITGICQSIDKLEWLDVCYNELKDYDKKWSKERGWPESIKLTTTKPSGTLSILAGSTPGIHPAFSSFYIRTIRMSSADKLVEICRKAGYKVEFVEGFDGSIDRQTCVVSFPCFASHGALLAKNVSAVEQMELVKKIQSLWADNAVSCTVYYKKDELDGIKAWLKENYQTSIKSISFLLHKEHGFRQAPYQEISDIEYHCLREKLLPIDKFSISGAALDNIECQNGVCPIK